MEETLRPSIRAIIGLGNPGRRYIGTRHNLGFEVVDILKRNRDFRPGSGDYFQCQAELGSSEVVLLKPTTFMNHSGIAVKQFVESSGIPTAGIMIIADDFNIALGRTRLRQEGSDGGHNGLASIIYHLGTEDFPRIRLGIGPVPGNIPAEEFVLEKFAQDEQPVVKDMISRAADATTAWIRDGFDNAAAIFNRAAQ